MSFVNREGQKNLQKLICFKNVVSDLANKSKTPTKIAIFKPLNFYIYRNKRHIF